MVFRWQGSVQALLPCRHAGLAPADAVWCELAAGMLSRLTCCVLLMLLQC